ncbi:MAG: ion channel, partial [Bacteroidota bacterium]
MSFTLLRGNKVDSVLRVGLTTEPPFVIGERGGHYTGLSVDLWEQIAEEAGIRYTYTAYSDHLGLIRALDYGEISLSINPIHVNEIRLKMLTASQPFYVSSIGVATTRVDKSQVALFISNFFSVEFLRIILLLILIIFIFGTILWAAERKHNTQQFRSGLIGLFDGLWWSAVTMTTVGYGDKAPKTRLGRVIAMIWMFTAIIIISGFTASIASTLTVKSLSRNIEDVEDLRESDQVGSVYASSSEEFLRRNDIDI